MTYGDYTKLSESAAESNKRNKEYAKSEATSRVDKTIDDFKKAYADTASLIRRKSGRPFETEFGYIPFDVHEDYKESHVTKKNDTSYYTSYSATVNSSGDVSIDPHTDSFDYTYYDIETKKKELTESTCFKLVKKNSANIVKQKEAAFLKSYSNFSSAYNEIDHETKTVKKPTQKYTINGKRVRITCIINRILSLYMIFWSIVNLISNYSWWDSNFSDAKGIPTGTFIFCVFAFFSIINNIRTSSHIKKTHIDPEKRGGIETRNELSSYHKGMCAFFVFSICVILVAIVGLSTSKLYLLDMLLTLITIVLSFIMAYKSIKRTFDNDVRFINSCVNETVTPEELLASPSYEKMIAELKEIQEYNLINLDSSEDWFYDYENIMRGEMSVKEFARLHPEFIVGNDPIDPDDPELDYFD